MNKKLIVGVSLVLTIMVSTVFGQGTKYFQKESYLKNEKHNDLRVIKMVLKSEGLYNGEINIDYDKETVNAIKLFQKENELSITGDIDKDFIAMICDSNQYPIISSNIYKIGMESEDVAFIQKSLDELGFFSNTEYTNYFGYKTEQAVKDFQKSNDMVADGIVGKETIKYLYNKGLIVTDINKLTRYIGNLDYDSYENGDRSPDLKVLQKALAQEVIFDSDEYTNLFGDITEDSVKSFQMKYNLEVDGVVGKGTIDKLEELGYVSNNNIVSRGGKINGRYGEYLSWKSVKKMVSMKNTTLMIEDFYTGKKFKVLAAYGTNHIDIEMISSKDSTIVKQLWGGSYSWKRRPVLVYINNRVIAASMNGMPHAGREDSPEGITVSNRSGDFGRGYNYDSVKGNGVSGVACLHFKDSKLHKSNKVDPDHKKAIMTAAGLI